MVQSDAALEDILPDSGLKLGFRIVARMSIREREVGEHRARLKVKGKGRRGKKAEKMELKKYMYCMLYKLLIIGSESTLVCSV